MAFIVKKNKIYSDLIEVKALDQCNLSCFSCNELSPVSANRLPTLAATQESLEFLEKVYHAKTARILGGEPLLRRDIADFVKVVKASGIADSVRIVSNGTYLERFNVELLQALDSVEISLYPGVGVTIDSLMQLKEKCLQYDVALYVKQTNFFRISYSELGTKDNGLVNRIFKTCKVVHLWGCHCIYDGFFFKCTNAPNIDRLVHNNLNYPSGIKLEDKNNFYHDLVEYLTSDTVLPSCKSCLGNVGLKVPHSQVVRDAWRASHQKPSEELVDYEYLMASEKNNEWMHDTIEHEFHGFSAGNGIDGLLPLGVFSSD